MNTELMVTEAYVASMSYFSQESLLKLPFIWNMFSDLPLNKYEITQILQRIQVGCHCKQQCWKSIEYS